MVARLFRALQLRSAQSSVTAHLTRLACYEMIMIVVSQGHAKLQQFEIRSSIVRCLLGLSRSSLIAPQHDKDNREAIPVDYSRATPPSFARSSVVSQALIRTCMLAAVSWQAAERDAIAEAPKSWHCGRRKSGRWEWARRWLQGGAASSPVANWTSGLEPIFAPVRCLSKLRLWPKSTIMVWEVAWADRVEPR
nr:hypothetical protein Iba_chr14bCG6860 [Ipomoea batatas]